MKWKTPTGRLKDIPMHHYLVDWMADQDSQFSAEVLEFFRPYWRHDVVCAQVPVAGNRMSYDYVNVTKRIIVEADGIQHDNPNSHFHGGSNAKWLGQIKRDHLKNDLAAKNGFTMIRIKPDDMPLSRRWVESTFGVTL